MSVCGEREGDRIDRAGELRYSQIQTNSQKLGKVVKPKSSTCSLDKLWSGKTGF